MDKDYFSLSPRSLRYNFFLACERGNLDGVLHCLANYKVDINWDDGQALCKACELGYDEIVRVLLEQKDTRADVRDNYPLRVASQNGHANVVKLLLARDDVDPAAHDNEAIGWAKTNNHVEVVEVLLNNARVCETFDFDFDDKELEEKRSCCNIL